MIFRDWNCRWLRKWWSVSTGNIMIIGTYCLYCLMNGISGALGTILTGKLILSTVMNGILILWNGHTIPSRVGLNSANVKIMMEYCRVLLLSKIVCLIGWILLIFNNKVRSRKNRLMSICSNWGIRFQIPKSRSSSSNMKRIGSKLIYKVCRLSSSK